MSNLLKSKFFLGAVIVAVMFVGVVATNATPAAADCSITSTLRVGSTGTQVVCLQTALGGLTADGNFGPLTKAAVVKFQQNSGLVADGIFGPKSNAVWVANAGNSANFPAGCTSASGYSLSTGLPCTSLPANTFAPAGCTSASGFSPVTGGACYAVSAGPSGFTPAGCTSASGFSPVTGGACQASNLPAGCTSTAGFSPTTGGSCSGAGSSTVVSNGAGSLTLTATTADVENTAPEGVVTKVLGIRAQASGSDISVGYVNVTLENKSTFGTDSERLDHYASEVSVYMGSVKVGSALASDFTKNGRIYTATIPVSGAVVKVGSINKVNFYVVVTPITNIDTGDSPNASGTGSTNFWNVIAGGFRFTDGTGLTLSGADPVTNADFTFKKIIDSGDLSLKVAQSSNPVAGTVAVSTTTSTSNVLLNSFTMKPVGADMTMTSLTVTTTATGATGTVIAQNLTLTANGVQVAEIDSVLGADGAPTANTFNLDNDLVMTAGSTVTFKVYAKVNAITGGFSQGDSLLATFTSAAVEATSGGASLSSLITGSSTGNTQTFRSTGVSASNFSAVMTTTTDGSQIARQSWAISYTLTAFGDTYYVPKTTVRDVTAAAHISQGAEFGLEDSTGTSSGKGTLSISGITSSATTVGSAFEIPEGESRTFTATVALTSPDAGAGITGNGVLTIPAYYQIQLTTLRYDDLSTLASLAADYVPVPAQNFQTGQGQMTQ